MELLSNMSILQGGVAALCIGAPFILVKACTDSKEEQLRKDIARSEEAVEEQTERARRAKEKADKEAERANELAKRLCEMKKKLDEARAPKMKPVCQKPVKAKTFKNLDVVTFANHKGGVGKSTLLAWIARYADENSEAKLKVLAIDMSVYGDASKLLLPKEQLQGDQKGIEDFVEASLKPGTPFDVKTIKDYIVPVLAGENLYLMTCRSRLTRKPLNILNDISDAGASHVADVLRSSLSQLETDGTRWVVLIDTDGGTLSGYTKLALAAADRVAVPLSANTNDADRLHVFLAYLEKMHNKGLTSAKVTDLIFNNIQVYKKNRTEFAPFTPPKASLDAMKGVKNKIDGMVNSFPKALAMIKSSKSKDVVTSMRDGKSHMQISEGNTVFSSDGAGGTAEKDLKALAKKILKAVPQGFGDTQKSLNFCSTTSTVQATAGT